MTRSFVFSQTEGRLISQDIANDLLSVFLHDEGVQFWVDICEATDEEAKGVLDGVFHFHPLAIEDCLTPTDNAKVDEYEGYILLVMHAVKHAQDTNDFKTVEVDMFIGKNFLVTYHREPVKSINATIDRIMKNAPAVARAPDRLTYTILDFMFENYTPLLDQLSLGIGQLEDSIMKTTSVSTFEEILDLKTRLQSIRQIVSPQREVLARVGRGEFKIVRQHMLPYYRDLLDQLSKISIQADNYRDSLTSVLQVNLNLRQMEVNRVIKVLTVMATLSMPMLVVTSFYGMNINHWPTFQFSTSEAYGWILFVTGITTLALYLILRRKGWS